MKVLSEKAKAPIAGLITMIFMVMFMPALGIYVSAEQLPVNFSDIWWQLVVDIAPIALPVGLLLGTVSNIFVGLFVKPTVETQF